MSALCRDEYHRQPGPLFSTFSCPTCTSVPPSPPQIAPAASTGQPHVNVQHTRSVLSEVLVERERQEDKWGQQNHGLLLWNAIMGEEVGEVANAILERDYDNYRTELIQVAAVAVAAVESYDRGTQVR